MKCKNDKTDLFDKDKVTECLSNPNLYDNKTCTRKEKSSVKPKMVDIARDLVTAKKNDYAMKQQTDQARLFATALLQGRQLPPKQELAVYIGLLKKFVPNVKSAKNREKYVKRCLSKCDTNNIKMDCIKSVNNPATRTKYDENCVDQSKRAPGEQTGVLLTPAPRPRKAKPTAEPTALPTAEPTALPTAEPAAEQSAGKRTKQKRSRQRRTRKASFFGLF
jgi:hypothetical protein